MLSDRERYIIPAVLRAAQILEAFSPEHPEFTNVELSRKLNLNKSSVMRLLCSLEAAGLLERDERHGAYRLTSKVYQLGMVYIRQVNLHTMALPVMAKLAESCGEAVHLGVLHHGETFYIEKIEGPRPVVLKTRTGESSPAHCTALGKILLSGLDENELETYLNQTPLTRYTDRTNTDIDRLRSELVRVRRQGYAVVESEFQEEVKGVAAPVFDRSGRLIAAISLAGPAYRISHEFVMENLVPAIMQAGRLLSQRMGYPGWHHDENTEKASGLAGEGNSGNVPAL